MPSRIEFSRKTRRQIIDRANGHCEACKAVLKAGEGEIDHILPAALGGDAKAANGRLICRQCHKEKTKSDVRQIRKADRQRDKASGAFKPPAAKIANRNDFTRSSKRQRNPMPALPPKRLFASTD